MGQVQGLVNGHLPLSCGSVFNRSCILLKWLSAMWLKLQNGAPETLEPLGHLESQLMERIWARGEICVGDLHAELESRLAYTTVMTTVDRLFKKGLLDRRKVGKAFFYNARLSENEYHQRLTQHFVGMVMHDSKHRSVVLSGFVDAVSGTDQQMLEKLEELVKAKRRALRNRRPE